MASEAIPIYFTKEEIEFLLGYERPLVKLGDINSKLREGLEHLEPSPRYTVELTTEGWQIKDNEKGTIGGFVYASKEQAQSEADHLSISYARFDEVTGQGRN